MNEMVERVARAICKSCGGDADRLAFVGIPELGPRTAIYIPSDESSQKPRPLWQFFASEALEAILAMRDPTEAMLNVGPPEPYMDKDVWTKMIDEALK